MIAVALWALVAGVYLAVMARAHRSIYGRGPVLVITRTPRHQCRLGDIDAERAVIAEAERIIAEAPR